MCPPGTKAGTPAVLAVLLAACLVESAAAGLVSPWSWQKFPMTSGLECKDVEGPTTLPASLPESIYDSSSAEHREDVFDQNTKDVDQEWAYVARTSDFAVDAQDAHRAECMYKHVNTWAGSDAFVCDAGDSLGTRYYRARFTAGIAASFLKGSNAHDWGGAMNASRAWFQKLQDCNRDWLLLPLKQWGNATSNHSATDDPHHAAYPALLSVLLTSVILQDEPTFLWAAAELNAALDTVTLEGTTINEQDEQSDALFHHSAGVLMYAVPAAIVVHVNAATPWNTTAGAGFRDAAYNRGLARLAYRTAEGLFNPDVFVQKFGFSQADVGCIEESWGWLYWNLLQEKGVGAAAATAVENMTTAAKVSHFRELVERCSPEHTFTTQLGGRTCWWYPATFYDSPCRGWTEGQYFAYGIAGLAIGALVCMCACFLCHRDTCMSWASHKKDRVGSEGAGAGAGSGAGTAAGGGKAARASTASAGADEGDMRVLPVSP